MMKYDPILLTTALLLALWITTTSERCTEAGSCNEMALVMNKEGLDGCKLLLQLHDKTLLLPSNAFEFEPLAEGDTVSISYDELEFASSICMAEDMIVELRCLSILGRQQCVPLLDPIDREWAKEVVMEHEPYKIEAIAANGMTYYRFYADSICLLYDCHGRSICRGNCGEDNECSSFFEERKLEIEEQRIIYVQDN